MTTLHVASAGRTELDLACSTAGRFILWRRGRDVWLTVDERHASAVHRALAFRGVGVTWSELGGPTAPRSLAAIGTGLAPARLAGSDELDVLDVRVVPLSEATASLTRHPVRPLPISARRRSRCRALLRGTDALLEVRRTAWCGRSTLAATRHSLRPMLFDRSATPPTLRVYAADGALTRWING